MMVLVEFIYPSFVINSCGFTSVFIARSPCHSVATIELGVVLCFTSIFVRSAGNVICVSVTKNE